MFLNKMGLVGAVLVAAVGVGGLAYQAGGQPGAAQAAPPDRPASELEALRKEIELLRLNLQVVLEKVRAQEAELRELRAGRASGTPTGPGMMMGPMAPGNKPPTGGMMPSGGMGMRDMSGGHGSSMPPGSGGAPAAGDPVQEAEAALKQLREARDTEGQRRAADALEHALEKLKQRRKADQDPNTRNPFQAQ
jgi:hypothetical protein